MTEERELKDTLDAVYNIVTAFQKSLPDDFDDEMLCAFILTISGMAHGLQNTAAYLRYLSEVANTPEAINIHHMDPIIH